MICYQKTDGLAHDLRLVAEDYVAGAGEILLPGDALPTPDSLSDPASVILRNTPNPVAVAEQESGMDRGEREMAIKFLPPESKRRQRAEKAEAAIAALNVRKVAVVSPVTQLMDAVTASTGVSFSQDAVSVVPSATAA